MGAEWQPGVSPGKIPPPPDITGLTGVAETRRVEEEMEGYHWDSVLDEKNKEKDQAENDQYMSSITMFGNQMVLEIIRDRVKQVGQPKRDATNFEGISLILDDVISGYEDTIGKDNFVESYSRMLIRYSNLKTACYHFMENTEAAKKEKEQSGKKSFFDRFKGNQKDQEQRIEYSRQISIIAEREMSIIRSRSGKMANSYKPLKWRDFFLRPNFQKLEKIKQEAYPQKETGTASVSDQIKKLAIKKSPSLRKELEPTEIELLSKELAELKDKYAEMQAQISKLSGPSGELTEKPEETASPIGLEEPMSQ